MARAPLVGGQVALREPWREVRVVARTGSTNDDLAAAARAGEPEGLVLVAEAQTAGRGRLDRRWVSPPGAGLTFSVLLRPDDVPVARWAWLPLLAGLSVRTAVERACGVPVRLKWPNDLLAGGRKLAGVLVAVAGGAAVAGVGLNVSTTAGELPRPDATSLTLEGAACTDRAGVLGAVLDDLGADYLAWRRAGGDPLRSGLHRAYTAACDTLGRTVRVDLPDGGILAGTATALDEDGRLLVSTGGEPHAVAAGDVRHVR